MLSVLYGALESFIVLRRHRNHQRIIIIIIIIRHCCWCGRGLTAMSSSTPLYLSRHLPTSDVTHKAQASYCPQLAAG